MTCQHCTTDAHTYRSVCGACNVRRTARLSKGGREAIAYHVAKEHGMTAGKTFAAEVERERGRLEGEGKL